jgi:hypothetical protein
VPGHLFEITYTGPTWLTGGQCGMAASVFSFVAALDFVIARRGATKQSRRRNVEIASLRSR